jgi:hypothetical protein
MYRTSLPPSPDSPSVAAAWARGIALAERPALADPAERLARDLVAQAVRRTPLGGQIQASVTMADGLRIEVRDPGGPDPAPGPESATISAITTTFGSEAGPDGHMAWAEVKA